MSTTRTNFLVKIEDWFENGLSKLENKMPTVVYDAATKASGYMETALKFLEGGTCATVIATLVPALEPARDELITICEDLQKDFAAISEANKPALILGAQAASVNAVYAAANSGMTLSLPAAANAYVSAVNA